MDGENSWRKIVTDLSNKQIEIATVPSNNREPLWFCASSDENILYVENAKTHNPSTKMSKRRIITKDDFLNVFSYYLRWSNGEKHLRQNVRLYSRNTAYIFALLSHFK